MILGKGTYLNAGNAVAVQHGLVVGQTLELLKALQPGLTEADLESLRQELKRSLPSMGPEVVSGLIPNVIVGRIANRLDLMGPSYTVDAACASSMVAVQHALRDLRDGACDLALVGGAQIWIPMPTQSIFCQLGALSRRQQIRPFDKDADGTLLGEGIGMLVLKRLRDAEADGDRIYAVVREVGVASDGRGMSVMAPRLEGEELAIRRAYEGAGIDPRSVGLIEAHGTGTPVGDLTEVQALTRVFGRRQGTLPRCALGSVKSMISHTIPASGAAGIIKAALSLYHKVLPPTLHCDEPNPKLELERTPFYLNTEARPWIHGAPEPRRAGVSSFGFGGINAHVILEEYRPGTDRRRTSRTGAPASASRGPRPGPAEGPDHLPDWDSELLVLGAGSPAGLMDEVRLLGTYLDSIVADGAGAIRLKDLAAAINRDHAARSAESRLRLAIVAASLDDLRAKLERASRQLASPNCRQIKHVSGIYHAAEPLGRGGKLAFLFPGEGAQYPNMLADLCLHFPEVRECFDQIDRIYLDHPRGDLPSDHIFPRAAPATRGEPIDDRRLWQIDGAVEAVLTANQAMLTILRQIGVGPDVIVGHSTGEFSAVRAAGVLDPEREELSDFVLRLYQNHEDVSARGEIPRAVLIAVGAENHQVEAVAREVGGAIFVAMDNCPHQAVLVGGLEEARRAQEILRRDGLIFEILNFDRAYHTPLFAPYAGQLRQVFERAQFQPPRVPIYSCTTASPYPSDPEEIRELMVEHWLRPVEFRRTIETLHDEGVRLFVEVGPRGNLSAFVEDILRGRPFCAVPANVQRRSGTTQLNHLAGLLTIHGVDLDLEALHRRREVRPIDWRAGVAPPAPRRVPMKLHLGFPGMTLSEDFASRWRSEVMPEASTSTAEAVPATQAATAAESAEGPPPRPGSPPRPRRSRRPTACRRPIPHLPPRNRCRAIPRHRGGPATRPRGRWADRSIRWSGTSWGPWSSSCTSRSRSSRTASGPAERGRGRPSKGGGAGTGRDRTGRAIGGRGHRTATPRRNARPRRPTLTRSSGTSSPIDPAWSWSPVASSIRPSTSTCATTRSAGTCPTPIRTSWRWRSCR